MKDWEYYSIPEDFYYPDKCKFREKLVKEIDEKRLTAAERKEELAKVNELVNEWFLIEVKPYQEECRKRENEFWIDCREDLGYDTLLNAKGVELLEAYAYERGHSSGFSEIYCELVEVSELVAELAEHIYLDFKIKNNR
jgi:acyl-CoA thioesterase